MAYRSGYGQYPSAGMPMPMPQVPTTAYQPPIPSSNHSNSLAMESLVKNLLALVKDASKAELDQLLNNDDKLNDLVQDAEQTKYLKKQCQDLMQHNKDQAVTNISLQPEFKILKSDLLELIKEHNELKEKFTTSQQKIASTVSLDGTLAVLQASTAEKEAESEKTSQDLLDSDKSVDDFVSEFIPQRKVYHLRKVKSEKLSQLLQGNAMWGNTSVPNRPAPVPRPRDGTFNYGGY